MVSVCETTRQSSPFFITLFHVTLLPCLLFSFSAQFAQFLLLLILKKSFSFTHAQVGYKNAPFRLIIFFFASLLNRLCYATLQYFLILLEIHTVYYLCSFILCHMRAAPALVTILLPVEAFKKICEATVYSAVFETLQTMTSSISSEAHGSFRRWGSLGWGLASLVRA